MEFRECEEFSCFVGTLGSGFLLCFLARKRSTSSTSSTNSTSGIGGDGSEAKYWEVVEDREFG
jgi:hypothetical protein